MNQHKDTTTSFLRLRDLHGKITALLISTTLNNDINSSIKDISSLLDNTFKLLNSLYSYHTHDTLFRINQRSITNLQYKSYVKVCKLFIRILKTTSNEVVLFDLFPVREDLKRLFSYLLGCLSFMLSEQQLMIDKMYSRKYMSTIERVDRNKCHVISYLNTLKNLSKVISFHNKIFPSGKYILPVLNNKMMNKINHPSDIYDIIIKIYNNLTSATKIKRTKETTLTLIFVYVEKYNIIKYTNEVLDNFASKLGKASTDGKAIKRFRNIIQFTINVMKNESEEFKKDLNLNSYFNTEKIQLIAGMDKELVHEFLKWVVLRKNIEFDINSTVLYLKLLKEKVEQQIPNVICDLLELLSDLNFKIYREDNWIDIAADVKSIFACDKFNKELVNKQNNNNMKALVFIMKKIVYNREVLQAELAEEIKKIEKISKE